MNADLPAAPELAQLALPFTALPRPRAVTSAQTAGRMAGELSRLAAAPQRWWDLVRFDTDGPARIPVPGADGAWLLVLPPGGSADCDCRYATLLAGEAFESAPPPSPVTAVAGPKPLRPGRVRVRGRPAPHRVTGAGHGYAVSLHWAGAAVRPQELKDFYPERSVPPAPATAVLPRV